MLIPMIDAATARPARFPAAEKARPTTGKTASFASRCAITSIIALLIIPVGIVALLSGLGLVRLPYEMFLLNERIPLLFGTHMAASALALLLLPFVIACRHRPDLHRALGRTLGAFVVIGGLTALPVAVVSSSGDLARAGFFVQGLVWLGLFASGWRAIRAHDRRGHARLMLAMAAVTTGAVWFRLMIGTALLFHMPFEATYAFAAWAGWMIPLSLVWAWPPLTRAYLR
ncbi:MAG: DUF2306 domain-containing protein [Hyphomicrobium sp.]